ATSPKSDYNRLTGFALFRKELASRCYGSGAPGRKFFEDIAATPASPSPSKGVGGEPGTQSSSSAGSANQNTTWFRSVRTPVMLLKAKASSMMASTRTDPAVRIGGEVPDILNRAEGRHRH